MFEAEWPEKVYRPDILEKQQIHLSLIIAA